jgi:hypothetical protein
MLLIKERASFICIVLFYILLCFSVHANPSKEEILHLATDLLNDYLHKTNRLHRAELQNGILTLFKNTQALRAASEAAFYAFDNFILKNLIEKTISPFDTLAYQEGSEPIIALLCKYEFYSYATALNHYFDILEISKPQAWINTLESFRTSPFEQDTAGEFHINYLLSYFNFTKQQEYKGILTEYSPCLVQDIFTLFFDRKLAEFTFTDQRLLQLSLMRGLAPTSLTSLRQPELGIFFQIVDICFQYAEHLKDHPSLLKQVIKIYESSHNAPSQKALPFVSLAYLHGIIEKEELSSFNHDLFIDSKHEYVNKRTVWIKTLGRVPSRYPLLTDREGDFLPENELKSQALYIAQVTLPKCSHVLEEIARDPLRIFLTDTAYDKNSVSRDEKVMALKKMEIITILLYKIKHYVTEEEYAHLTKHYNTLSTLISYRTSLMTLRKLPKDLMSEIVHYIPITPREINDQESLLLSICGLLYRALNNKESFTELLEQCDMFSAHEIIQILFPLIQQQNTIQGSS